MAQLEEKGLLYFLLMVAMSGHHLVDPQWTVPDTHTQWSFQEAVAAFPHATYPPPRESEANEYWQTGHCSLSFRETTWQYGDFCEEELALLKPQEAQCYI